MRELLADALVDEHVRVDRDAQREHEAGDARQRQRGVEQRQPREDQRAVEDQRHVRDQPGDLVVDGHEEHDQRQAHQRGQAALLDQLVAQRRAHLADLAGGHRRRQRARLSTSASVCASSQPLLEASCRPRGPW